MMSGGASTTPIVTHEYWDWQQGRNGDRLTVRGFTNLYKGGPHAFNVGSFSIEQISGNRTLTLLDFTLNLGAANSPNGSLAQEAGSTSAARTMRSCQARSDRTLCREHRAGVLSRLRRHADDCGRQVRSDGHPALSSSPPPAP